MNFNHNTESETEAVGFSDKDLQEWKDKNKIFIKSILDNENVKFGEVAQAIAEKMSYNELIFTAAKFAFLKAGEVEARRGIVDILGKSLGKRK